MSASRRDLSFLVHEVFDFETHYQQLQGGDAISDEFLDTLIDEMQKFAVNELEPLNASGDIEGCTYKDTEVTTPEGFKEAYKLYIEGGWAALSGDPEFGGQGLPTSMTFFLEEMMSSANMAWTMYPGLSRGVVTALETHGSAELKKSFLVPLLTGAWTGTMCLTEPHAGSDVGLAKTKAEEHADGGYRIDGTKIFISAGEHDMSDNIVHLVLARLPESPAGTRGISMFVVPKFNLDGERNGVTCGGIEEKMGIHGNATCVLHFDDAKGYLVGAENKGMKYMFTMMNAARIVVGLQGVCLAQAAYNKAQTYAVERLQMRSLSGPKYPELPADPIIVHPDVRRMLLAQRSIIEGGRALVYFAAQLVDQMTLGKDEQTRADADQLLDFLTPVVKAFLTELGFESVNHAVQIFGGHGFITETGVEQHVRDARITLLYEGTTQIQALDLLGRKVLQTQGAGLLKFSAMINELVQECAADLPELAKPLADYAEQWGAMAIGVGAKAAKDVDEVGSAAVDFLMFSGYVILAYFWARSALAAQAKLAAEPKDDFYIGKVAVARFYFQKMLPRADAHKAALEAGADTLMSVSDAALTSN